MSHPSRDQERGTRQRRRRKTLLEPVKPLEDRCLLAPFLSVSGGGTVTFTAAPNLPAGTVEGTVTVTPTSNPVSPAGDVSVAQLTPISSFGGDIVRIKAGPGGDFGKDVYAISRGAGDNASIGAINRPGVIYRVDPATGKSSVFFDLNTVMSQLEPGGNAGNSLGNSTGLVNWYDITFDPEGYFDGRPSMFVSSVDRSDPNKNAIYRIAPDGSFLGLFTAETEGLSTLKFTRNPSAIMITPPEQQTFLRGLFAGTGTADANGNFDALFFDANQFRPGTPISGPGLPPGVTQAAPGSGIAFTDGPQLGFAPANTDYFSPNYSVFSDFGTPGGGGIPAQPGFSGVQGQGGDNLIGDFLAAGATPPTTITSIDTQPLVPTTLRRFQDIGFDQYGYFSYGQAATVPAATTTTTTGNGFTENVIVPTGFGNSASLSSSSLQIFAGSLFVSDLATGYSVTVTPTSTTGTALPPVTIGVTALGSTVGVITDAAGNQTIINQGGIPIGGRIVRISPDGIVTNFAQGFHVSTAADASSFVNSELSISFSADGTTLYASDEDGIWQFKSVTSLANSTAGSIIGLNDLRTFGVPYEGQDSAVAIIDTGVDATTPQFRGRVAPGTNVVIGGTGNDDLSAGTATTTGGTGNTNGFVGSIVGSGGAVNTNNNNNNNNNNLGDVNGHGTPLAGVVAQFVPQATLDPVDIFSPFLQSTTTGGGGGGGGGGTTNLGFTQLGITTNDAVYNGFNYVAQHPFVADPVRPNTQDRVVAASMGFGTNVTFDSEGVAYRKYPQIVIAFKNQLKKFRSLGITPIAAAGQFGEPVGQFFTPGPGFGSGTLNDVTGLGGDVNGMALPAILDEVVSVTGTYSFPYTGTASTAPNDQTLGATPRPVPPQLVAQFLSINGGTGSTTTTGNNANPNTITSLTAGDGTEFANKILASSNRNSTTDFAAPELDIPTFRRQFNGDGSAHNVFDEAGTSLSSGIVTGSFALVSSAIDYWSQLNAKGLTVDSYLTGPVGVRTLNYGAHAFPDLTVYAQPDGINSILQWTAVPALDQNVGNDITTPPQLIGSTHFRQYSRIDVGNAIAAIEGTEALNYLLAHNTFTVIDADHNGLITAQEVQNFVDESATIGMPEAGSMARLLGGTARASGSGITVFGEQPDQPDALQRRFNFFDWSADGQLNGAITIQQFQFLAKNLLPTPDAFTIVDRQRASNDAFLVDPAAQRNYKNLQHLQPRYEWVPKSAMLRFRNISPARFGVNRGLSPNLQAPTYTLFHPATPKPPKGKKGGGNTGNGSNSNTGNGSNSNTGTGGDNGNGGSGGSTTNNNGASGSGSGNGSTTTQGGTGTGTSTGTTTTNTGTNTSTGTTTGTGNSSNQTANVTTSPGQTGQNTSNPILAALEQIAANHGGSGAPAGATQGSSTPASSSSTTTPSSTPTTPTGSTLTADSSSTTLGTPTLITPVTTTPPAQASTPAAGASAGTSTGSAGSATTTTPNSATTAGTPSATSSGSGSGTGGTGSGSGSTPSASAGSGSTNPATSSQPQVVLHTTSLTGPHSSKAVQSASQSAALVAGSGPRRPVHPAKPKRSAWNQFLHTLGLKN